MIVGIVLVALFILLISLRGIASFYTDYLWFDSLSLGGVWRRVLLTKATLTIVGAVVFFLICWSNLLVAERLAPVFRPTSGEDDLIERYHQMVGKRTWLVRAGLSLFLALIVGISLGSAWNQWILFHNGGSFGQKDATFHTDIGFYVFKLPFLVTVAGWLFSSVLLVLFVSLLAHVVNGGIRFHTQLDRVTPQVKAHISVLLGVLALVQVGRYWLDRYQLAFSTRGAVDGATYTAVNVELRSIYLLMAIALFAVGLFLANIWRRGWVLPGMAVGLWILVAVLAGGVVPAFVQRVRVEPNKLTYEGKYVTNNISATRSAYNLAGVTSDPYNWKESLNSSALAANVATMANIRLWDPTQMQDSFKQKQAIRSFYEINDVDVDRYVLDGKTTEVMIAARDLSEAGVPKKSWESIHLAYTHGYGVVAATANDKAASGDPSLVAQDIPVKTSSGFGSVDAARSGIYFGEKKSGYVVVDTNRKEIDYQGANNTKYTTYKGDDGVRIGSGPKGFVRKMAFALRFGDLNPLLSSNITPDSKVLFERDVTARVKSVAPFLAYDHDPYMVLVDGKLQYVLDAYTTTSNYPNAQRADTGGLNAASGLRGRSFNYARNSVKAVVDAYDGTVKLYVVDRKDPIIKAYEKAFPELFTPVAKAPKALRDHFRYPEDLFTVQTQMWAKYHVSDPDDFINENDFWAVPTEAGGSSQSGTSGKTKAKDLGADGQEITPGDRYQSQYVLTQLPGDDRESFVLMRPYVSSDTGGGESSSRNQLRAFIAADSDPNDYGQIKTYVLPATALPNGPTQAAANMQSDENVGNQIKSLCNNKTTCTFAAPAIVPVDNSLLYVQSFFVTGAGVGSPKLEQVIVSYERPGNAQVAIAGTLRDALVEIFGPDVPSQIEHTGGTSTGTSDGSSETGTTGTVSQQESALIDKLVAAFADANAAARSGDLVGREQKLEQAQKYASQLQTLRAQATKVNPAPGTKGTGSSTTTIPATTTTTRPPPTTTAPASTTQTTSAGA
ncbi:MAG: hypothetical protein JWM89_2340 [Acidimicrobiales bacterium]|nr:hypothetical protein [Acidimicrobiales bacterium]